MFAKVDFADFIALIVAMILSLLLPLNSSPPRDQRVIITFV
jgi:hypothetical protein